MPKVLPKCNGKETMISDKEIQERIRRLVQRVRTEEPKKKEPKLSYYERHKEERLAYQNRYNHEVLGYKERAKAPKKTEEQKRQEINEKSKAYYHSNKEQRKAYNRNYYWEHREYFLKKSKERYRRMCEGQYDKL